VSRSAIVTAIICMVTAMTTANADSKERFSASPLSGTAPLVVTFTGQGSGHFEGVMALDFGDGETDRSISTIRGFTRTHTYAQPGTYTAELKNGPYGGQRPAVLTTVERVTITVN
jgi:PKD repeat protein